MTLNEAVKFHGHLGPYLILGLKAGNFALKKLKAKKYFGIEVKVFGLENKPKSCIIDGLQLSTGATFGKGNIKKYKSYTKRLEFANRLTHKRLSLSFNRKLTNRLKETKDHKSSEILARKLFKEKSKNIFTVIK